jgi:predicted RNase H-like HicB family nuclease
MAVNRRSIMVRKKRAKAASRASFTVRFFRDEDGCIVAYCKELPGCVSQGKTLGQARENIREAMVLYLETLSDLATGPRGKSPHHREGKPLSTTRFSLEPLSA